MDKSKKRSMTGCKQRAATSKGSKTKVEVYRHFDPALKSRSFGADDFPEVVVEEKASRRSAGSPTSKMKKMQKPSTGNCYEIRICTEKRSSSSDRKESKAKMSSASSSSSYLVTKKTLNDNEDKGKKKKTSGRGSLLRLSSTETASKQPSAQLSLCSAKLKELICACDSKNKTRSNHEPAQFPCSAISDVDSKLVIYRDPIVEKIKEEIGMSAQFCNDEVKQTVAELKEEIAKYRKTLHRNVNYLQTKVKSGLSLDRRFKENAIQTEPSPNLDNMEKFGELVTKIAEMLHIDDGKPIDLLMAPRPQKVVSTSTETSPPSRKDQQTQKGGVEVKTLEQQTETTNVTNTQDKSIDNPKNSLEALIADKSMECYCLEEQKENLSKVDKLIERAERSLKALKTEFYQNANGVVAPPVSICSEYCCYDDLCEHPMVKANTSSLCSCEDVVQKDKSTLVHFDLPSKDYQPEPKVCLDCCTSVSVRNIMSKDATVQSSPPAVQSKSTDIKDNVLPIKSTQSVGTGTAKIITNDKSTEVQLLPNNESEKESNPVSTQSDDIAQMSAYKSDQTKSSDCTENDFPQNEHDVAMQILTKSVGDQTENEESDCSCPSNTIEKDAESIEDLTNDDVPDNCINNDAHLNTISEHTEIDESDVPSHNQPTNETKKEPNLNIQRMPQIDIKPPLTIQNLCNININPTCRFDMTVPRQLNIGYREVTHNTSADKFAVPNLLPWCGVTLNIKQECLECSDSKDLVAAIRSPSPQPHSDKLDQADDILPEVIMATDPIAYLNKSFVQNSEDSDSEGIYKGLMDVCDRETQTSKRVLIRQDSREFTPQLSSSGKEQSVDTDSTSKSKSSTQDDMKIIKKSNLDEEIKTGSKIIVADSQAVEQTAEKSSKSDECNEKHGKQEIGNKDRETQTSKRVLIKQDSREFTPQLSSSGKEQSVDTDSTSKSKSSTQDGMKIIKKSNLDEEIKTGSETTVAGSQAVEQTAEKSTQSDECNEKHGKQGIGNKDCGGDSQKEPNTTSTTSDDSSRKGKCGTVCCKKNDRPRSPSIREDKSRVEKAMATTLCPLSQYIAESHQVEPFLIPDKKLQLSRKTASSSADVRKSTGKCSLEQASSYRQIFNIKNENYSRRQSVTTQTTDIPQPTAIPPQADTSKTEKREKSAPKKSTLDTCGLNPDIKSDESSESEYVLGHDVSTQVVPEDTLKQNDNAICTQSQVKRCVENHICSKTLTNKPRVKLRNSKASCCLISNKQGRTVNIPSKPQSEITQTRAKMPLDQYATRNYRIADPKPPQAVPITLHEAKTYGDHDTSHTDDETDKSTKAKIVPCGDNLSYHKSCVDNFDGFFTQTTSDDSCPSSYNRKPKRAKGIKAISSSSDDFRSPDESISEGEIKCKCSVSIGELHLCRYAYDIKSRCNNYRKHPEKVVKPHDPHPQIVKQTVYYDNWISYYTSPGNSPQNKGQIFKKT